MISPSKTISQLIIYILPEHVLFATNNHFIFVKIMTIVNITHCLSSYHHQSLYITTVLIKILSGTPLQEGVSIKEGGPGHLNS